MNHFLHEKQKSNLLLLVLLFSFFIELWIGRIVDISKSMRLTEDTITKKEFREMEIGEEMLRYLQANEHQAESTGTECGLYLLESKFGYQSFGYSYEKTSFKCLKKKWEQRKAWPEYLRVCQAIWNDVRYFPVASLSSDKKQHSVFENSWLTERTFGGKRGHEGTDILPPKNIRGLYPIISMTDGVVKQKGWLQQGGYRIGIVSPSGCYFYYAHLDSYAALKEGDVVQAGDILGFMGDSGYGAEGTTGKFPVHLHVGMYIYPNGTETSVNPYWILRYMQNAVVHTVDYEEELSHEKTE